MIDEQTQIERIQNFEAEKDSIIKHGYVFKANTRNEDQIQVGDLVRFVCNASDEDGDPIDRIMRVTGRCTKIELDNHHTSDYPKYYVRRNGKNYWYYGDDIEIIKKGKRNRL